MRILQISAKDTDIIRNTMLDGDNPIGEHAFDLDDEDLSFHLGAFENNKLVSVASFYFEKHPYIDGEYHYRLCGQATLPEFQKQGYGKALLKTAYPIIKNNSCSIVWCNVREEVVNYYKKSGFEVYSKPFDIPKFGAHYLMIKKLD